MKYHKTILSCQQIHEREKLEIKQQDQQLEDNTSKKSHNRLLHRSIYKELPKPYLVLIDSVFQELDSSIYQENLFIKSYEFIFKKMAINSIGGPVLITQKKNLQKFAEEHQDLSDKGLDSLKEALKLLRFCHQLLSSSKIKLPLIFHSNRN